MGFTDLIKNVTEKTTELVKNEREKNNELKQLQTELMAMQKVSLSITSNYQSVHASPLATMYQKEDGTVFFNRHKDDSFTIIDYSWSGPKYDTVSHGTVSTNTQEHTKGKSGKMLAGAVVGGLINPVGAVIGTAVGAGGKKKKNSHSISNQNTITQQIESPTPGTLKFRNNTTGEIIGISFSCDSVLDSKIKCFNIQKEAESRHAVVEHISKSELNPYEELKKLKELLDMGIISQEEFDRKKEAILNI